MVFSDTTNNTGLIQDCEMLVFNEFGKISGNTSLIQAFTNFINRQYDKATSIIIENDGRWQHDDTAYLTEAVYLTTLTSGQNQYTLDPAHLKILGIRVKDESSNWSILRPLDMNDPEARAFRLETNPVVTGDPIFYDKRGDQVILYPTPDYTQASSLEITVQRIPNYFTYDDTTQTVGISQLFHRYLSLGASMEYAVANRLDAKNDLMQLFKDEEDRIKTHYSNRGRDEQKILRAKQHNPRWDIYLMMN
jgi:hypothetical protein